MRTTIALGNAPSSGSSLLGNLLDSTPFTACGPELNLFSSNYLYDFDNFKNNLNRSSSASSVYLYNNKINFHRIHSYGHSFESFKKLVNESSSLQDFLDKFALHFLALRGKDINGVVFEKTPQNLTNIKEYLEKTNNYFVHIVRDPIDVYKSLLKRGYSDKMALLTWFIDEAKMYSYLDHERVILIKYEELLKNPYEIVSEIIKKVTNRSVSAEEIEIYRDKNIYRKLYTFSLDSWNYGSTDKIQNSNSYDLSNKEAEALYYLSTLKIGKYYSITYDIPKISFSEILSKLGYEQRFMNSIKKNENNLNFTNKDKLHLFLKITQNLINNKGKLNSFYSFNPVTQNNYKVKEK